MDRRHWIVMSSGAIGALLVGAGAAGAHIEPVPGDVQAGAPVTVEFLVEHGCGDADTTGMLFQIPASVTNLEPVAKEGWTTTVEADTVAFTDGVLDHDTEDTFALAFTAPSSAGPIDFPVVQQCGDTEERWIEIPQAGAAEPEHPAPRVNVVGEAPPADTTTTAAATTTGVAAVTTIESTVAPATTAPLAEATTTSTELAVGAVPDTTGGDATTSTEPGDSDGDDDGGSSSTAWVIIAVIVVAAAGGAFVYWSRSRSAS